MQRLKNLFSARRERKPGYTPLLSGASEEVSVDSLRVAEVKAKIVNAAKVTTVGEVVVIAEELEAIKAQERVAEFLKNKRMKDGVVLDKGIYTAPPNGSILNCAVKFCTAKEVKSVLDRGHPIHMAEPDGTNFLYNALRRRDTDILDVLVKHYAIEDEMSSLLIRRVGGGGEGTLTRFVREAEVRDIGVLEYLQTSKYAARVRHVEKDYGSFGIAEKAKGLHSPYVAPPLTLTTNVAPQPLSATSVVGAGVGMGVGGGGSGHG